MCPSSAGMAHKFCTEEGSWFRHPESNQTWSNYTTCVDVEDLEVRFTANFLTVPLPLLHIS